MTPITHRSLLLRLLAVGAALLIGVAGGCSTKGDADRPDDDGTTSPSASTKFEPRDRSADLLDVQVPAPQGSSDGVIREVQAKLNVSQVKAGAGGTVLTFWYTGPDTSLISFAGQGNWETFPQLVDPAGKQIYEPVSFTRNFGAAACVCTDTAFIRGFPQPRTALYPKLPNNVTEIQVRKDGFNTAITIPVTRE